MIPVDQDVFGKPNGNCFTACLASLLQVPLTALEPVQALYREGATRWEEGRDEKHWVKCWAEIQGFIAAQHAMILVGVLPPHVPAGYSILGGGSPRGDFGHYVVAHDGEVVHDPHPSRDGIVGSAEEYLVLLPVVRG